VESIVLDFGALTPFAILKRCLLPFRPWKFLSAPRRDARPPVRDLRPPKLKLPPGACDTHFHFLGPQREFPFNAKRNFVVACFGARIGRIRNTAANAE
jgi:hypothetical protein